MAQLLRIDNYSSNNITQTTALSADIDSGGSSLPVVNNSGFTVSRFALVGRLGSDVAEWLTITSLSNSPSPTIVSTDTLKLDHSNNDPVTELFGDKIKIYRAANTDGTIPADNLFSVIDTIDIQTDNISTDYTDDTGGANYWYKYTYYNQLLSEETNLDDSVASRGGGYDTYCSIDDIRKEAGLSSNDYISDADVDSKRRKAQAIIDGALQGLYAVPFTAPINPMIEEITIKMAAGLLLNQDYGPFTSGNSKSGDAKIKEANDLLTLIDNKHYILTDTLGNDLSNQGAGGIKSFPDSTADTLPVDEGGSSRAFRYGMRF